MSSSFRSFIPIETYRTRKRRMTYLLYLICVLIGFFLACFVHAQILTHNERQKTNKLNFNYEHDIRRAYRHEVSRITYYRATGNRMANGAYPEDGAVAVSDRSVPLGTRVFIDGQNCILGSHD